MAAKNNENEITNAMPKSVAHISAPQWPVAYALKRKSKFL
jgi:hypothetical protein